MTIKEMQLHGVTSIEVKQTNSMQEAFGVCTRRIRFETNDGTSFTVIAFADHETDLKLNIEIPKALKGEN